MSRLADRILNDCQPFRASLLDPGEWWTITRKHLEGRTGRPLSHKEFERQLVPASSLFREGEPVGIAKFDPAALRGVPVFAADDVGRYVMALPRGTEFADIVATMAPPFDKFFVEFQGVPNGKELHAWGALITAQEWPEWVEQFEGDLGKPRWVLELQTFLDREKGKPFGPVAEHYAGLAEDGTWFRHVHGRTISGYSFSNDHAESPAAFSEVDMSKDKQANLIKAKCPNCKATLLVKPSVTRCPGCGTILAPSGKGGSRRNP